MPTSLWGLALYVVALFPGIAFVFAREGHRPVGKRSAFRETATVVFVSTVCDIVVSLIVVLLAALFWPEVSNRATALLRGDLTWAVENFPIAVFVAVGLLGAATMLGYLLGSKWAHERGLKSIWASEIPRDVTAWQQILLPEDDVEVRVGLTLKSGIWVSGTVNYFDNDPDSNPHRTITLSGKIIVRPAGSDTASEMTETDWMIVEAGEIEMLQAAYYERTAPVPAHELDAEVPVAGGVERVARSLTFLAIFVIAASQPIRLSSGFDPSIASRVADTGLGLGVLTLVVASTVWLLNRRARTAVARRAMP